VVGVLEQQHLAAERVDQRLPPGEPGVGDLRPDHPGEPVVEPLADRHGVVLAARQRDVLEGRAAAGGGDAERRDVGEHAVDRLGGGQVGRRRQRDVAPVVGAEEHQIAAADHRGQVAVAHRDAADLPRGVDLDEVAAAVGGDRAGLDQLRGVEAQRGAVALDPAADGVPGRRAERVLAGRRGRGELVPGELVAPAGQQRPAEDQGAPAAGAQVDARLVGVHAERLEVLAGAFGGQALQVAGVRVAVLDVEIGVADRLGVDRGRVGLPGGERRTRRREHERGCGQQGGEGDRSARHQSSPCGVRAGMGRPARSSVPRSERKRVVAESIPSVETEAGEQG
jgi:hypothetical protein